MHYISPSFNIRNFKILKSYVVEQAGLGLVWLEILTTGFSQEEAHLSIVMRKLDFCICENKDKDQLRGNCEADQRLCFRSTASTIPLLPIYKISSL